MGRKWSLRGVVFVYLDQGGRSQWTGEAFGVTRVSGGVERDGILYKRDGVPCTETIILVDLFAFAFLNTRFLFIGVVTHATSNGLSMGTRGCILNVDTLKFLLCPLFGQVTNKVLGTMVSLATTIVSITYFFLLYHKCSCPLALYFKLLLFLLLNDCNNTMCYGSLCLLGAGTRLTHLMNVSCVLKAMLRVTGGGLVHASVSRTYVLSTFVVVLTLVLVGAGGDDVRPEARGRGHGGSSGTSGGNVLGANVMLVFFITLVAYVFDALSGTIALCRIDNIMGVKR